MDKVLDSPAEAIADLGDGARIAISGFGQTAGSPVSLLGALRERGTMGLCLIANGLQPAAQALVDQHQVSRLVVSFTTRAGTSTPMEEQIASGEISFELVPQGTLVERMRAGGAGLAAIYTPTALGTPIAAGKEVRCFDGGSYVLEMALRADYAFIAGVRADRLGNVEFRGANVHFGPSFAKASRTVIVEVDEIVDAGEIPPERVGLPGIFVDRVVRRDGAADPPRPAVRRPPDQARHYHGKPGWTRAEMAERAAALLPEPSYVNLGLGIPTYISSYVADRDIVLHAENGVLAYGPLIAEGDGDPDVFNAGGQLVARRPGMSFFDSVAAFEMIRSGRVGVVALGAYQVDRKGSFANWATPEMQGGGIGGAMDLVAGGALVMVLMEHHDSRGRAKLVESCTYPLTGVECVDVVVTDLAVLRRAGPKGGGAGFTVESLAPGFTSEEVMELTEFDPGT